MRKQEAIGGRLSVAAHRLSCGKVYLTVRTFSAFSARFSLARVNKRTFGKASPTAWTAASRSLGYFTLLSSFDVICKTCGLWNG